MTLKIILIVSGLIWSTVSWSVVNVTKVSDSDLLAKNSIALAFKNIKGGTEYCSAVLIEQDVLLTAAHCVADDMPTVLLGTEVQRQGTSEPSAPTVEVAKVYVNKAYEKTTGQDKFREDIAIIHLKKPLPSKYTPAAINFDGKMALKEVVISGFGAQTLSGRKHRFFEQAGATETVDLRQKTAAIAAFDATVLQIKQTDGGVCSGDSGGGAYSPASLETRQPLLEGINIKAGDDKGVLCGTNAFILRTSSKKDWIQEQLVLIDAARGSLTAQAPGAAAVK